MQYRELPPVGEAREFVDCYWLLETAGPEAGAVQRVVPDGRPELILNLDRPFESFHDGQWHLQPRCFLAGQITGPLLLRPTGRAKIMGVRFRPHGAARAFGAAMQEASDRVVPVRDLASSLARALDNACEAASFEMVQQALLAARGKSDALAATAAREMARLRGACSPARLAAGLGLSSRQLERRFLSAVGMSPKLFCRVQRFQGVFPLIEAARPNWVEVAAACGYYDQAHLIRDCKDFAGETPAALLDDGALAKHFLRDPAIYRHVGFIQDNPRRRPLS